MSSNTLTADSSQILAQLASIRKQALAGKKYNREQKLART